MSFVDFKEVSVNNPGSSIRYGGDDLKGIMQILNGKIVAQKRPRIVNEWIWLDHFDMAPPAIVPAAPIDTNANRIYVDPVDFKVKVKKTNNSIRDIENIDIPDSALATITNRAKLPSALVYDDEVNTFTVRQNINKVAETGIAEIAQEWKISDDTLAYLRIMNESATDGRFVPGLQAYQEGSNTGPIFRVVGRVKTAQDTDTTAALVMDSRRDDNTALVTRALFTVSNNTTAVFRVTPTSIDFTSKTLINPGNVLVNTADNNIGDHFLDFGDIAVPGNPAAGTRRLYLSSTTGELSIKKSDGAVLSLEALVGSLDSLTDVIAPTPALNNVLTFDGTNWVPAVPPGATGGEANLGSNVGSGGIGIFKQKTGVTLEFKKLNAGSSKVTITDDTGNSEVDIDIAQANMDLEQIGGTIVTRSKLPSAILYEDETATFTEETVFLHSKLRVKDVNATYHYIFTSSDPGANREMLLPALTANDTFVFAAFAQTLTNKTINADSNTITNIENADIKAAAAIAWSKIDKTGSLLGEIDNIALSSPVADQVLTFNGTEWINQTPIAGVSPTNTVTLTNKTIGDFLKFIKQGSTPVDPSLEDVIIYVKAIDANTNGLFIKIKYAGAIIEGQLFP